MKKIFLLLFFIPVVAFGQKNTLTISGKILDGEDHLPMPYANVELFSLPDSTFLRGTITELDGSFSISSDIASGDYFLQISFVGFETTDRKFNIKTENVNLGRITLKMDAILLEEAVIVAEAIPVIVQGDTTIFSASAFRVADGAALEELVKKLPGIEISESGKITFNGKEITRIMVDGKEFFTDDPQVALKNLPANMVERVRAYDRRSDNARLTGMNDDDDETVLDLSVKKGMKQGWIGNVLAGAGNKERYEAGGMLNRFQENSNLSIIASMNNTNNQGFSEFGDARFGARGNAGAGITSSNIIGATFAQEHKNMQLGGSVQYGYSDNDTKMTRATEIFLPSGSFHRADTSASRRKRDDLAVNFRMEWKPDSMTTITFRPSVTYAHTESRSTGSSWTSNSLRDPVNHKSSFNLIKGDNVAANGHLQYFRRLNKQGRNFSLSARTNYSYNQSDNYSDAITQFFLEEETDSLEQFVNRKSTGFTYHLQGSYTEPISAKHFLQFRYGFQQRNSTSSSFVYEDDERDIYLDSLSNKVKNQYNTHQIEANFQGQQTKLSYNIGFSLEPQFSQSEITAGPNTGRDLKQQVVNYAPNVRLRYRLSKQEMLMIGYRGRSSAPNVEYLQNVIDINDPLNLQFGNPDLKPSYRNTVMLRYSNFVSATQRSYSLNANFTNTLNDVTRKVIFDTETGGKRSYMVNVNGNWSTAAFFTFSSPLTNRKFTISSTTGANYADEVSFTSERSEDADAPLTVATKSTTNTFNLRERVTGSYRIDLLDVSLNASVNYMLVQNSIQSRSNRETVDYEFGGNTNVNLPYNMYFSTDINCRIFTGYSKGFNNTNVIWNAHISKNFLKNNAATVRFKIYDILQQQSSLTRAPGTSMSDTEYNTLGSYFMVHFVYRINTLGRQSSRTSRDEQESSGGGYDRPQRQNFEGRGGEGRSF